MASARLRPYGIRQFRHERCLTCASRLRSGMPVNEAPKKNAMKRFFTLTLPFSFALPLHATAVDWHVADEIVARIKPPQFPARDFAITDYGAVSGGEHDCTGALRRAIE